MKTLLLAFIFLPFIILAEDWNGFRGNLRDGKSNEKGLLNKWPEDGPKLLWTKENIGLGYSGFSTADGKAFIMGTRDNKTVLFCLDENTGKELWSKTVSQSIFEDSFGDGPRGTAMLDEGKAYVLSGSGDLVCFEQTTGEKVWSVNMKQFGGKIPNWGYAETPLIDGNKLLCTPGGPQGSVIALDKTNGKLIWQSKNFTEGAQHSSIIKVKWNGVDQYIRFMLKSCVGINTENGDILWKTDWKGNGSAPANPLFLDGHIFISSVLNGGGKTFRINKDFSTEDIYSKKDLAIHHQGAILLGKNIVGPTWRKGWMSIDLKSGKILQTTKFSKVPRGPFVYADNKLYCQGEDRGVIVMLDLKDDSWEELSRFTVPKRSDNLKPKGRMWTQPVISNGKLFLRDQEIIYCYQIK